MSWTENDSKDFIDFGDFFIPYRRQQAEVVCQMISEVKLLETVVDLCCGEGYWCQRILQEYSNATVYGFDISEEMLSKARQSLAEYQGRFKPQKFDLAEKGWRATMPSADVVVSSLAIHHLNPAEKKELYADLYAKLNKGGVLLISDLVLPTVTAGYHLAGRQWEDYVKHESEKESNPAVYQEFIKEKWNFFYHPQEDPIDQPSGIFEQLCWLNEVGFENVDVYWMFAGHAIFGGWK